MSIVNKCVYIGKYISLFLSFDFMSKNRKHFYIFQKLIFYIAQKIKLKPLSNYETDFGVGMTRPSFFSLLSTFVNSSFQYLNL